MNNWKPISEAPKDGTFLLIGWRGENQFHQTVGWWEPQFHYSFSDASEEPQYTGAWSDGSLSDEDPVELFPTHFMPLPEPPTS